MAISRTAASELDSCGEKRQKETAVPVVISERRGELRSAGGDGSRRRRVQAFSGD